MDGPEQSLIDRAFNDYIAVLNHSAELPDSPEAKHHEVNRRFHICVLAAQIAVEGQTEPLWYDYMKSQLETQPGAPARASLEPHDWLDCSRSADGSLVIKVAGLSSFSILQALLDRDESRVAHRAHAYTPTASQA
jgi:hypothetical protein